MLTRAIPGAAAVTLCGLLAMGTTYLGWSAQAASTLATLSAGFVGLTVLATVCRPFSPMRAAVLASMSTAFVLMACLAGKVFFFVPLTWVQLGTLAGLCLIGTAVMLLIRPAVHKRLEKLHHQAQG